ncbi:MAG: hypothetical protein A2096_03720 [Spirochaetes bacterium GWF1_41_5]|nr:MAG: hypothetical protein A2096_03720 [Spirochaetes bacterium GWF1_41_5]HBE02792.1 hypothetical protein [Spirochaetia bacterium]
MLKNQFITGCFPVRNFEFNCSFQNGLHEELHAHNAGELCLVFSGGGSVIVNNRVFPLMHGQAFIIPRKIPHGFLRFEHTQTCLIHYNDNYLLKDHPEARQVAGYKLLFKKNCGRRDFTPDIILLSPERLSEAKMHVKFMEKELLCRNSGFRTAITGSFISLLMLLAREAENRFKSPAVLPDDIARAVSEIEKHYQEKISIKALADLSNLPRTVFFRRFQKETGFTPLNYITNLRIRQACSRLSESRASITHIAWECGFQDSNYFSRIFKKYAGCPPRRYRKNSRAAVS